jgi:hypothetical protein
MNDYFSAPSICQSKSGGVYDYVCEYHAKKTGLFVFSEKHGVLYMPLLSARIKTGKKTEHPYETG